MTTEDFLKELRRMCCFHETTVRRAICLMNPAQLSELMHTIKRDAGIAVEQVVAKHIQ